MKIIKPSAEVIAPTNVSPEALLRTIERAGRTCYKSEGKMTNDSAENFVMGIIRRGHESVLEHVSLTVRFICDRGVTHEIVRHRLASYSQESTRYCNYSNHKFGGEITVIEPLFFVPGSRSYERWKEACSDAEDAYFDLLEMGATPQEARSVLPNSLKTEIVMTANVREWRHFFKLRCSSAAHPQMQQVAQIALQKACDFIPVVFDDIYEEVMAQNDQI